jgi:cytochrome c peroxidase
MQGIRQARFIRGVALAWIMAVGLSSIAMAGEKAPKFDPRLQQLKAQLGKSLFNDTRLSSPAGMSCSTCHDASTGFTGPSSQVNLMSGPLAGVVPGRFGNRKPPTISYAQFLPVGPPYFDEDVSAFVGGLFWDGRAEDLVAQAQQPFVNPNEMNDLIHNMAAPQLVVEKVRTGPSAVLFQAVFGRDIFSHPTQEVYVDIADAIAAFEETPEVSPFTSKYDAYVAGTARLSDKEMAGLRLFTGSTSGRPGGPANYKFGQCVLCHGISSDPNGQDLFTNSCYANIGVPRNPNNPFYKETNEAADPEGYNPEGEAYIDLGLGGFLYTTLGLPPGNMGPGSDGEGDYLAINGTFKAPTLRNVDKRPYPSFVKDYMHNGAFKSLKQVVHFYNTRNLTSVPGEVIDFTQDNPYAGLKGKPNFPEPEYPSPDTLQNPNGAPPSSAAQVGNLGLTDQEEDQIVAFVQTLTDGYFRP